MKKIHLLVFLGKNYKNLSKTNKYINNTKKKELKKLKN